MAETTTTTHIATSARLAVRAYNLYIKERIAPIERLSKFYGELKGRGRVSFGNGGNQIEYRPTLKRRRIRAGAGNPSAVQFDQVTTEKVVQFPWRTYDLGEHTTKFERLATKSEGGYFGPIAKILDDVSSDFLADMGEKFYLDGYASGSSDIMGLESWNGNTGSCISNSVFADPSDTYGGLSTQVGVTGSWTPETGGGWPTGTGDVEYHSWSPFQVDYNNTSLGGSTANWENQWQRALNRCATFMLTLMNAPPQTCIMAATLLAKAHDSLEGQTRFTTTPDSVLVRLGHRTLEYNGIEVWTEYGVPEAVAYLMNWDKLELRVMGDQLIEVEEDYDIRTGQRLYKLDTYLNMFTHSPAYQGKLVAISAEGT